MITQWNYEEEEALQGLPWGARLLYLQGLRRYMDYRTGIVGLSRRVSWAGLTAVLYVEPHQGITDSGSPSKESVRRMAKWLERAGLVEMRSDKDGKQLIFFLPKADVYQSAQKKPDTNPTQTRHRQPDTEKPSAGAACSAQPDSKPTDPKPEKPTYIPESDIREDKEKEPTDVGSKKKRATRLTAERVPGEWVCWCSEKLLWSTDHAARTFEVFRDYWIAAPGEKGRKEDWFATWRNWCRREDEKQRTSHAEHQRFDNSAPGKVERAYAERRAARAAASGEVCSGGSGNIIDLDARDYRRSY